jgi:hypothetical protein
MSLLYPRVFAAEVGLSPVREDGFRRMTLRQSPDFQFRLLAEQAGYFHTLPEILSDLYLRKLSQTDALICIQNHA